jgi:pimeloyl-ACP methyl ester carboxylesterase
LRDSGSIMLFRLGRKGRISMRNAVKRQVILVTTIVAALASGASAWAGPADPVNPLTKRFLQGKPLDICDQGSLYVGGVPKNTIYANSAIAAGPPADLIIGQMYVQFQIPTKHRQWPPLILVHGAPAPGTIWEATPDGREGWLPHALQNNFSMFVVDQAGRARSGFDRSVLHEARVTNNVSLIPTLGPPHRSEAPAMPFG